MLKRYCTIIARYVAKWGIAQMCLCQIKYHQRRISHHFGGLLTSLKKYRATWGIAGIVWQYRAILLWGHQVLAVSVRAKNHPKAQGCFLSSEPPKFLAWLPLQSLAAKNLVSSVQFFGSEKLFKKGRSEIFKRQKRGIRMYGHVSDRFSDSFCVFRTIVCID